MRRSCSTRSGLIFPSSGGGARNPFVGGNCKPVSSRGHGAQLRADTNLELLAVEEFVELVLTETATAADVQEKLKLET